MTYFFFVSGFIILLFGAKWLVDGAASIGKKFGLPQLIIGLTLVALGTSLPELVINVFASIEGSTDLAIGNVLGSNIMNTLLIIGVAAMIHPIAMASRKNLINTFLSLLATLLLILMANCSFSDPTIKMISRPDGIVLILMLIAFLIYLFSQKNKADEFSEESNIRERGTALSIGLILVGSAGLFFGGKWIVNGVDQLANDLGMSQTTIGLTIVAAATSLPELVTSIIAALNKNTDMAVGNAIGSNLFNLLLVLGISALITPIEYNTDLNFQMGILVVATLLVLIFIRFDIGKPRKAISRIEGIGLVLFYFAFMYLLFR